jgi:hypothetical protein
MSRPCGKTGHTYRRIGGARSEGPRVGRPQPRGRNPVIPLKDLPTVELYPAIAFEILEDAQAGWDGPSRFLGNLWLDREQETGSPTATV